VKKNFNTRMKSLILVLLLPALVNAISPAEDDKRNFTSPLRAYEFKLPNSDDVVAFAHVTEQTLENNIDWCAISEACLMPPASTREFCKRPDDRFFASKGWPTFLNGAVLIDDSSRTIEERATLPFAGPPLDTLRASVFSEPADRNVFARHLNDANVSTFNASPDHASNSFAVTFTSSSAKMANGTAVTCVLLPFARLSDVAKERDTRNFTDLAFTDLALVCGRVEATGTFVAPRNDAIGAPFAAHLGLRVPLARGFDAERDVDWTRKPLLHTVHYDDCTAAEKFVPSVKGEALIHIPVKCSPTWRLSVNATKDWPCDKSESNVRWMPLVVQFDSLFGLGGGARVSDIRHFARGVDPNEPTIAPFVAVQRRKLKPDVVCPNYDDPNPLQIVLGPRVEAGKEFVESPHGSVDDSLLLSQMYWRCEFCTYDDWTVIPTTASDAMPIASISNAIVAIAIAVAVSRF
jgi:hypothetical protein